ncbi:MAG: DUF3109 family protein [Alistipes sp.]|nr:DUF3109 family protein [Alistipes sp.]
MIEIDGKIVSLDILTERFCCDIGRCRGMCCVEGNSGAPLEQEECAVLRDEFQKYRDYLKPEGLAAIGKHGFYVVDQDGDLTTPLIDGAECAYAVSDNGITFCAIEKAWREGRTTFRKPVSCHLYPVRVAKFSDGSFGLNYHRWDVCSPAVKHGKKNGVPVYRSLREALVRRFGDEFYTALEEAERLLADETAGNGKFF